MSVNIPITSSPRIVIVGGGFGGLELAKGLKDTEAQIVLIDKNNYHTFQPLLYQVATGPLSPGDIAAPLRVVLRRHLNVRTIMGDYAQLLPAIVAAKAKIPGRGPYSSGLFGGYFSSDIYYGGFCWH